MGGETRERVGRKTVLNSSFVGSKRWYNSEFQDAMAICREFRKPDYFITFTCNPNWTEITQNLRPGETAQDRPDIVARLFKLKVDQLMDDLVKNKILGKAVGYLSVTEWQKRGNIFT